MHLWQLVIFNGEFFVKGSHVPSPRPSKVHGGPAKDTQVRQGATW